MLLCAMRTGIEITVSPASRQRLEAIAADRNTPQKHVWLQGAAGVLLENDDCRCFNLGAGAGIAPTTRNQ